MAIMIIYSTTMILSLKLNAQMYTTNKQNTETIITLYNVLGGYKNYNRNILLLYIMFRLLLFQKIKKESEKIIMRETERKNERDYNHRN